VTKDTPPKARTLKELLLVEAKGLSLESDQTKLPVLVACALFPAAKLY
jgi:hypothetical protein